ncbi:hypothetical protein [Rhizobium terrae]|uniref:hypothetical protein n=1 Tax=Rhizobium terrae TaxID=2171756 RepID=UPI0013C36ED4|nr:hypothetical protein [Rhizobium terrae]
MRRYAILKTIEHFQNLLRAEADLERKEKLTELIKLEYDKLDSEESREQTDGAVKGLGESIRKRE